METLEQSGKGVRQIQAEQTKSRLFEAAVSLLAEKEFEAITIREIVARAQVSIGTFYNYYATKMEVFYETYRVADHYFSETVRPLLDQPTARERIRCFFDQYAHYSSDLTDMKMTRLLYNPDNPWFNRDPTGGMVGILIDLIREGLARGELTGPDSAEEMASYLMIAVRGLVYHWCTTNGTYDLGEATAAFVDRLVFVYLAPEGRIPPRIPFTSTDPAS